MSRTTFLTWKVKFTFSAMHVSGSESSFDPYTNEVGFTSLTETKSNLSQSFSQHYNLIHLFTKCILGTYQVPGCARCKDAGNLKTRRPPQDLYGLLELG